MKEIDKIAKGDVDVFLDYYKRWVIDTIRNNPEMLYADYWKIRNKVAAEEK